MKHRLALRHALHAGAAGAALALATAAGCSLPTSGLGSPGAADDGTAPAGKTGAPHPEADASLASDPIDADAGSAPDAGAGSASDAADLPDTTPPAPDAAPVGCDVDGDGVRAVGPACGGTDCCDSDARVHPGQTAFFAAPGACGGFDYDCDGTEKAELGVAMCKLNFLACGGDGFAAATACGAQADYVTCGYSGIICGEKSRAARTQTCH